MQPPGKKSLVGLTKISGRNFKIKDTDINNHSMYNSFETNFLCIAGISENYFSKIKDIAISNYSINTQFM